MTVQSIAELAELIKKVWSMQFYPQLQQENYLSNLFLRTYEGDLSGGGDTVKVNQIEKPAGTTIALDTANSNAEETITESALTINQIDIKVNQLANVNVRIGRIAKALMGNMQSSAFAAELRTLMFQDIFDQIEATIIAGLIPSASSPAHQVKWATNNKVTEGEIRNARKLLRTQKVPVMNLWAVHGITSYDQLLGIDKFKDADYIGDMPEMPIQSGEVKKIYGFNHIESTALAADDSFFFHPSAGALVIAEDIVVKASDMHAAGKRGELLSVEVLYGFKLMDNKRIVKYDNT